MNPDIYRRGCPYPDSYRGWYCRSGQYQDVRGVPWALLLTAIYSIVHTCLIFIRLCVGKDTLIDKLLLVRWLERLGNVCDCFIAIKLLFQIHLQL